MNRHNKNLKLKKKFILNWNKKKLKLEKLQIIFYLILMNNFNFDVYLFFKFFIFNYRDFYF